MSKTMCNTNTEPCGAGEASEAFAGYRLTLPSLTLFPCLSFPYSSICVPSQGGVLQRARQAIFLPSHPGHESSPDQTS